MLSGPLANLILSRYQWDNGAYNPDYEGQSKMETVFGKGIWDRLRGKTVLDFGCGEGMEAIEIARQGAGHVIGLDMRESILEIARSRLPESIQNCQFLQTFDSQVDVIISLDAFEHFHHPGQILEIMAGMLSPDGKVYVSFGPPWYHPKGSHLPALFPWAHMVFSEEALMTWRAKYKSDGARRFEEVEGGLNQMSIRKFERLVANSPLKFESLEAVPIRRLRYFHNALTREFFTALVRCVLSRREA